MILTLALDNGATSTGKNLYIKLTGTLGANRNVTIPDGSERIIYLKMQQLEAPLHYIQLQ